MTRNGQGGKVLASAQDLAGAGLIAADEVATLAPVLDRYRARITPAMHAAAADPGVAAQFVPRAEELLTRPEELSDPIGDDAHSPVPGLTHRYPDRAILHATLACDVYCRFCFRREVVGQAGPMPEAELSAALDYIARTPTLTEVILTGGDPLSLSPRRIGALLARLAAIPHVGLVRLHSRVPLVSPERMTEAMMTALGAFPAVWLVLHTNHAAEIGTAAEDALARLTRAGIPLLSQSVLLRGVNDSPAALADLFRRLVRLGVKPYYLHHCDLAPGTAGFRTTIAEGQALVAGLRGRISGLCQPTYVLDIPGGFGKVPVAPPHVVPAGRPGEYAVTDRDGRIHLYRDPERSPADQA